jgi:hypothetical protein
VGIQACGAASSSPLEAGGKPEIPEESSWAVDSSWLNGSNAGRPCSADQRSPSCRPTPPLCGPGWQATPPFGGAEGRGKVPIRRHHTRTRACDNWGLDHMGAGAILKYLLVGLLIFLVAAVGAAAGTFWFESSPPISHELRVQKQLDEDSSDGGLVLLWPSEPECDGAEHGEAASAQRCPDRPRLPSVGCAPTQSRPVERAHVGRG